MVNIISGVLGVIFITIIRMNTLKKDAINANLVFSYEKFFKEDGLSIISSILSVAIWYLLFPEASLKYPALTNFVRFSFLCSGAMGAYFLQKVLGKTKNWINCVIDEKTNKADGIEVKPPAEEIKP